MITPTRARRPLVRSLSVASLAVLALAVPMTAHAAARAAAQAYPDTYRVAAGSTLDVGRNGVLANDRGDLTTVVRNTPARHGAVSVDPDGSFRYTPDAGFTGTDTFTYATSDAVDLYRTNLPPLATIGGVKITGGAFGSSFTPVPGHSDQYYGLTDRGPNVDGPNGTKVEALPDFTPAIGKFVLANGQARLLQTIKLHAADGTPYNGQVNCAANTGETITDLDGNTLPCRDTGYDPEGLVALKDGTFWVSDEYGPFVTHFDRTGKQLGRLTPFDRSLPRELGNRVPNKGMEGLTVTPNGRTLVGIMQSALQQPDLDSSTKTKNVTALRIVTYDLQTHAEHEYVYLLTDPKINSGAVSEIAALSDTEFLVDERDGGVEPGAYKKLFRIDLTNATDVGPAADVPGATYDPTAGGLLLGSGKTIEATVAEDDTASATRALAAVHVRPVRKVLSLDVGRTVTRLDPTGAFFGHDKVEGIAVRGNVVLVSNDNDFGIDGLTNSAPPFQLHEKTLPNGQQDDGEYLAIHTDRLQDKPTTTTVSIVVR